MHISLHIYIERTYGKDLHRNENKSKIKSLFIPTKKLDREINIGYSETSMHLLFDNIILMGN